ncbi:LruC domain-containing protein [Polaribacter sp.]|uniref:LruC domain-containing protein n=1 Tax=Polaribacter sp. TaxID=1920175 RepID=UPI0040484C7D
MKTKYTQLLLLSFIVFSCTPDFKNEPEGPVVYVPGDITTLTVPTGHDLRPLSLQTTSVNLSETSRADMVKVRIFKIEGTTYSLLYEGFIDREQSISNIIKVPNHVQSLSVQADLATGTREWIVSPAELENIKIEDEARVDTDSNKTSSSVKTRLKSASDNPPTWNCSNYQEFSGNDDGDYKITSASTRGINVNKKTTIYICSGSWNPSYLNDNNGELTIYVGSGATLTLSGTINSTVYNVGTFNGTNVNFSSRGKFDNWGTTNITGGFTADSNDINIYGGVCAISGSFNLNDNGHFDNDGGQVTIGGHFTSSGKFHNKENSDISIAGNLIINGNGEFENQCKTVVSGNFINNKKADFKNASYTVITGSFISNSNIDVEIKEGSIFKCASIMTSGKIKGDKAFSVIQTGSITFNGNGRFQGSLDICSNSYNASMGDNSVINTCSTFISANACSPGFNNVVDADNDGIIAGVDVDDTNPSIVSYNYPQGKNTFFTSKYEDLYPCMGDYDLNDLVHNYSYQEGLNNGASNNGKNASITEIKFDYKFPAIGASFNNSLVLRVMDDDNNAALTLENSTRYSVNQIERLHDDVNKTTLFIFKNLKSIYTTNSQAIINTVKIDYADIPIISGKVTKINGAYDEFMLKNGELGQEIHPVYNKYHSNYPALNKPSKYFDTSNFSKCDDRSDRNQNLFINANKFPWVLNDLPNDIPWTKESFVILKGYPNFDKFVSVDAALDWYTDKPGNRNASFLIK